ncbi:MAG: response regulator transcription factor [Clostridiaceae bacterium]|nr:response regulator transcription factor [Clostridiaceae bacterium]
MNNILLIEDDIKLQKYITEYLSAYDYSIFTVNDYDYVIERLEETSPRLIILDINLPKFDGFYFLKLIRKKYNVPVIILSARSEEGEQIRGMNLGADDYITKPFSVGILLAKINALLRRVDEYSETADLMQGSLILVDGNMNLKYKEKTLELSKNEYRILKILIKNSGKIVTREELLETLWDDTAFVDDNTLTVNITRVKKRLSDLGLENIIVTKRGVGYVFNGIDN